MRLIKDGVYEVYPPEPSYSDHHTGRCTFLPLGSTISKSNEIQVIWEESSSNNISCLDGWTEQGLRLESASMAPCGESLGTPEASAWLVSNLCPSFVFVPGQVLYKRSM